MEKDLFGKLSGHGYYEFHPEDMESYLYAESHFTPKELALLKEGDTWYAFGEENLTKSGTESTTEEIDQALDPTIELECPGYLDLHVRFNGYVTDWWRLSVLQ